jgi:cytochrome b subunit of formate dehydrogenase
MYGRITQGAIINFSLLFAWIYHYLTIVTLTFAIVSLITIFNAVKVIRKPDPDWL